MTICPLCSSGETHSIEELSISLLTKLYKAKLNIVLSEDTLPSKLELRSCHACDLKFYNPCCAGNEDFYEQLQDIDWYYLTDKEEYDIAASFISADEAVLEIGVGHGAFAGHIQARSYVGLELSTLAVCRARARGLNVHHETIEQHARYHKREYDVVCSFQVLEHVPNVVGFLSASLDCLRQGGKLIVSTPSEDGFLGMESNNILNMPPHHMTRWSDKALLSLGTLFDLEIIDVRHDHLSDFHIRAYCTTLLQNCTNVILGRKRRCLDRGFARLLPTAGLRLFSLVLERGMTAAELRPRGHSVTAVFRKK